MEREYQAIVLGMGPAGMAAAMELARNGIKTAIVDQAQSPGGQVYRQSPREFSSDFGAGSNPRKLVGKALLKEFNRAADGLDIITEAAVWGSFEPGRLNMLHNGELMDLGFQKLVICEGARERTIPFPGWTLPGVLSVGGLQKMLANQGLVPGKRVLISGSGPLLMAAGANLVKAGGKPAGIFDAASTMDMLPLLPQLMRQKGLLKEALYYMSALLSGKTLVRTGWAVIRARGDERVREATICRVDGDWHPVAGTERTIEVDAIAVGYGFQAMCRSVRLFGCALEYDSSAHALKPRTDEFQRTTKPEVYAAGDGAGIGGAGMAEIQGRIAGLHAAHALDGIKRGAFEGLARPWLERRQKLASYTKVLDKVFTPKDGIYGIMDRDTIVCRCEGVSAGKIWDHIDQGRRDLLALKPVRVAMGPCQGRGCESVALEMLRLKGIDPAQTAPLGFRPPLSPLPISILEEYAMAHGLD